MDVNEARRLKEPEQENRRPLASALLLIWFAMPAWSGSGELLWQQQSESGGSFCSELVGVGPLVITYTVTGSRRGRPVALLRGYDVRTGREVWETRDRLGYHPFKYTTTTLATSGKRIFSALQRWTERDAVLVSARDSETGGLLWSVELEDSLFEYRAYSLAADENAVFVVGRRQIGSNESRTEVMLLSLDARTGDLLWSDYFNLNGGFDEARGMAVAEGRVVIYVLDAPDKQPWERDPTRAVLRAYGARTGELLWEEPTEKIASVHMNQDVVIQRNRILVLTENRNLRTQLLAHDLRTGRQLWTARTPGMFGITLAAARRTVAVYGFPLGPAREMRIRAYDTDTGRKLWRRAEAVDEGLGLFARRGQLFTIGMPELAGGFFVNAYRLHSGRQRWSVRLPASDNSEYGCSILLHKDVLITTATTDLGGEIVRAFEP